MDQTEPQGDLGMLDTGDAAYAQSDEVRSQLIAMAQTAGDARIVQALCEQINADTGMVRARLTLRVAAALGIDGVCAAASVEALHLASLIHDDLCDQASVRRGRSSVWASHGSGPAIAAGDLMIAASFGALAQDPVALSRRIALMQAAISHTVRGQAEDLATRSAHLSTGRYLRMAARKSGPLLGLGPALAMLSADRPADAKCILRAARWLAVAYQIADDMADIEEDAASGAPNVVAHAGQTWAVHLADRAIDKARHIAASLPREASTAFDHTILETSSMLAGARDAI